MPCRPSVVVTIAIVAITGTTPAARQDTSPPLLPSHIARMYPTASHVVWEQLLEVLNANGIRMATLDRSEQFLVTRDISVDQKHVGFAATTLSSELTRAYAQVHIFVPPSVEPARIYIGSKIDGLIDDPVFKGRRRRSYQEVAIGNWLFDRIAEKVGSPGLALPREFGDRAALAKRLTSQEPPACVARLLSGELHLQHFDQPVLIHRAHFEVTAAGRQAPPTVNIEAIVFEDGFVWPMRIVSGAEQGSPFGSAAVAGVMLSRYKPAQSEGCAVPIRTQFQSKFSG